MKKIFSSVAVSAIICLPLGGIIGWYYGSGELDFMCSKPYPAKLKKDLVSEQVYLKAGSVVNLKSCEYANRFKMGFYIDNASSVDLFEPYNTIEKRDRYDPSQYGVFLIDSNILVEFVNRTSLHNQPLNATPKSGAP